MDDNLGDIEVERQGYERRIALLESDIEKNKQRYLTVQNSDVDRKDVKLMLIEKNIRRKMHAMDSFKSEMTFLRPPSSEDIEYRKRQFRDFHRKIKRLVPDDLPLRFHGSPIHLSREIIRSGEVSSSVDRIGMETSYDSAGQISVTTKDSIEITTGGYSNLYENFNLPAGCIFVLIPEDEIDASAGDSLLMGNVSFKEHPDRLYGIISTPENMENLKVWAKEAEIDESKLFDFDSFIQHLEKQKEVSENTSRNQSTYVKLEDIPSLRDGISFHFTPSKNIDSILSTGLRPKIGDNSKGGLGKEALYKTFISYGLSGVLQLYNRLINASFEQPLHTIRDESHIAYLPEVSRDRNGNESLSLLEGFEFLRQYMSDNVYFIADTPLSKYEHELSEDDITSINEQIADISLPGTDVKIKPKIKELDDLAEDLRDKLITLEKGSEEYNKILENLQSITKERADLTITLRQMSLNILNQKRGIMLNESENPVLEKVDYNEERLRWVDQLSHPHNTHTRIIEDEEGMHGVRITSDMLRLFSKNGTSPSSGIDFIESIFPYVNENDTISIGEDFNLIPLFIDYINLAKQYKSQGLLIKSASNSLDVVDLSDISKYPGLEEFSKKLQEFYVQKVTETNSKKGKRIIKSLGLETLELQKDESYISSTEQALSNHEQELQGTIEKS